MRWESMMSTAFTCSAVKGSPLWNLSPSRSLNSYTSPSGLSVQDSARQGAMSLPGSGLIRASCRAYRNTNGVPIPGASPVDVPNASRNRSATDAVSLLMSSLHVVLEQLERPENRTRTRHVRRRARSCATAATKSVTLMGLLWYPPGDRWPTSPLPSRARARNNRRPLVLRSTFDRWIAEESLAGRVQHHQFPTAPSAVRPPLNRIRGNTWRRLSSINSRQRRACRGRHHQVRDEFLALGLRTEQQGKDEADGPDDCAHQHGNAEAEVVVDGKVGECRGHQATEDRPLVITEGAGRRAHLGGEALREVTRVLTIEGIAE